MLLKLMIIIVLILFAIGLITFPTGAYFKSEYQVDVELILESSMDDHDKQGEDLTKSSEEKDHQLIEDEQVHKTNSEADEENINHHHVDIDNQAVDEGESDANSHPQSVKSPDHQEKPEDESGDNESTEHLLKDR